MTCTTRLVTGCDVCTAITQRMEVKMFPNRSGFFWFTGETRNHPHGKHPTEIREREIVSSGQKTFTVQVRTKLFLGETWKFVGEWTEMTDEEARANFPEKF